MEGGDGRGVGEEFGRREEGRREGEDRKEGEKERKGGLFSNTEEASRGRCRISIDDKKEDMSVTRRREWEGLSISCVMTSN